jgi:hypothetical protein
MRFSPYKLLYQSKNRRIGTFTIALPRLRVSKYFYRPSH